jgi:nucleoside-diphosphate-sugar epimerase
MTRSESKRAMLYELGAVPVVADALDPDQVAEAVGTARPDVIVHELTAIGALDMRHFDRDFAATNRLRTEGTDHLLSAGQAVGVRRFVAQGVGAYGMYARTGGPVKSEEDPLHSTLARDMRETLAAGCGLFIHVAVAAEATAAAIEHGSRGVYNVVDDDPAPVADWLPALDRELGGKKPMRVPRFVGRLFAGEAGVVMMTEIRGGRTRRPSANSGGAPRTRAGGRDSRRRPEDSRSHCHASRAPRTKSVVGERRPERERSRATARRAAAGRVRDRLPDARQRRGGRRRWWIGLGGHEGRAGCQGLGGGAAPR